MKGGNDDLTRHKRKLLTKSNTFKKVKMLNKLGIERNFLNLVTDIKEKPTANIKG